MNITPDQADQWMKMAVPGPWEASFDDEADATRLYPWGEDEEIDDGDSWELARHAPDLAQTIAGMTEQWRHEAWHDRGDGVGPWRSLCWPHDDGWRSTRESADFDLAQAEGTFKHRLVRRLVGPVEETE